MRVLSNLAKLVSPSPQELAMIEGRMELKLLRKHEHFVQQGTVSSEIGFVEKGTMRLYIETPDKEICKDFLFENSVACSYDGFFFGQASRAGIQALQETQLLFYVKKIFTNCTLAARPGSGSGTCLWWNSS